MRVELQEFQLRTDANASAAEPLAVDLCSERKRVSLPLRLDVLFRRAHRRDARSAVAWTKRATKSRRIA